MPCTGKVVELIRSEPRNLYAIANFHNLPSILGAFLEDDTSHPLLLCEQGVSEFIREEISSQTEMLTYSRPKSGSELLGSLRAGVPSRCSSINLVTNSLMGTHNLLAASRFHIQHTRYVHELGEFPLEVLRRTGLKYRLLQAGIEALLRMRVNLYRWDHVVEFGLQTGDYQPPANCVVLPPVKHQYDAILLDLELSEVEIDLEATVLNLMVFLRRFESVAVKKHPSLALSLGTHLDLPELRPNIPAEMLANEDTTCLYLYSAAARAFPKRINILPLVAFTSRAEQYRVKSFIERQHRALGMDEVWYAK